MLCIMLSNYKVNEHTVLMFICLVCFQEVWLEGVKLAAAMNFKFPTMVPTSLHSIVTNASHDGIQLMADMLSWDPHKRPTAAQVCAPSKLKSIALSEL